MQLTFLQSVFYSLSFRLSATIYSVELKGLPLYTSASKAPLKATVATVNKTLLENPYAHLNELHY